jgi:prepilin-type N-terminal cleavage/methylation domain-containing protein
MVPHSTGERSSRDERGFTLIELMIVVAIVAILAAVVVPLFTSEGKKVNAKSEVTAMFAELTTKQERYKVEQAAYLDVPICPATPSNQGQDLATCKALTEWTDLGIVAPQNTLKCAYEVVAEAAGTNPTDAFTIGTNVFTIPKDASDVIVVPAGAFYTLQATCDIDGDGVKSYYLTSSLDATLQIKNEGE